MELKQLPKYLVKGHFLYLFGGCPATSREKPGLALLVTTLQGHQTSFAVQPATLPQQFAPQTVVVEKPAQPKTPKKPEVTVVPPVTQLSSGDIARFEEDYYRHVALFHALLKTAVTDAHYDELIKFKAQLDRRREELSDWRKNHCYTGQTPRLFADTYAGALPGESYVRGKSRNKKKRKKGTGKQETNRKYTSEEVSQILRDFTNRRRPSRAVGRPGRKGNFNSKIVLTTGQINPRANKRKGDW